MRSNLGVSCSLYSSSKSASPDTNLEDEYNDAPDLEVTDYFVSTSSRSRCRLLDGIKMITFFVNVSSSLDIKIEQDDTILEKPPFNAECF